MKGGAVRHHGLGFRFLPHLAQSRLIKSRHLAANTNQILKKVYPTRIRSDGGRDDNTRGFPTLLLCPGSF